ncbi:MAG: PAS domain-containing sensor histidine kinase [Actinomycetota bacterium]|nr:PAS domain-containing sensor histidine kinase [Actinomycetota bacterium]
MTTPAELALTCTDLTPSELAHLQRLLGSWSVLADLSFSDLLLVVPTSPIPGEEPGFVVMGQIRPSNRPTLLEEDLVGQTVRRSSWSLAAAALERGEVVRGAVHHPLIGESVPVENVPVRFGDREIAVMVRVYSRAVATPISMYEKNYFDVFGRLVQMIIDGEFPFAEEDVGTEETPRVGDGFVLVDGAGRIEFASPNAINALHRMGVYSTPEGHDFTELGVETSAVRWALTACRPVVEEVERRPDVIVLVQCIPLLRHHVANGAVILLRDVTDVRRLDRLLLSKDAAIREVHHRVKNNLQTISSLLSLQARRLSSADGKAALQEAERRVRSIAVVHEILSRDPGDQVPFDDIVGSLVRMAQDSVVSSNPVEITVEGDLGEVTADVATPLAVTLAEILQNAVEHAFGAVSGSAGADRDRDGNGTGAQAQPVGHVKVTLAHGARGLEVTVRDDGRGLEPGFDIERTTSLGLSIVRDLVVSQLGGSITMGTAEGGGTVVEIRLPPSQR